MLHIAAATWLVFATVLSASAQPGNQLSSNFGSPETAEQTLHRRALEAVIWLMPIVSVDAMRQAFFRDAGAKYGDIVWWSRDRLEVSTVTPSASTRYVYFNFNTKDGPVVVDLPAADWRRPAWHAIRCLAGAARSMSAPGARIRAEVENICCCRRATSISSPLATSPVPSQTYNGYAPASRDPDTSPPDDVAKAVALGKKLRLYPLAQAANPPEPRFIDMAGKLFDGIVRFDESFFASLVRMVSEEPVQTHDPALTAFLKNLRIEKGKQIKLNAQTLAALKPTLGEAKAQFRRAVADDLEVLWPGSRWGVNAFKAPFTLEASGGAEARRLIGNGSRSSVSTDRGKHCSRRPGSCRISRRSMQEPPGACSEARGGCGGDASMCACVGTTVPRSRRSKRRRMRVPVGQLKLRSIDTIA